MAMEEKHGLVQVYTKYFNNDPCSKHHYNEIGFKFKYPDNYWSKDIKVNITMYDVLKEFKEEVKKCGKRMTFDFLDWKLISRGNIVSYFIFRYFNGPNCDIHLC